MSKSLYHYGVKGMKWNVRKAKEVVDLAGKSIKSQLKMHKSIILRDLERALKSHEETTGNPIIKKLAGMMRQKVSDLRSPSSKVLDWVRDKIDALGDIKLIEFKETETFHPVTPNKPGPNTRSSSKSYGTGGITYSGPDMEDDKVSELLGTKNDAKRIEEAKKALAAKKAADLRIIAEAELRRKRLYGK